MGDILFVDCRPTFVPPSSLPTRGAQSGVASEQSQSDAHLNPAVDLAHPPPHVASGKSPYLLTQTPRSPPNGSQPKPLPDGGGPGVGGVGAGVGHDSSTQPDVYTTPDRGDGRRPASLVFR